MNGMVNEVLTFQPLSRIPSTKRFGTFLSIRSVIQRFMGNCVVRSSGDFRMECYLVEDAEIAILGVFHGRRDPSVWKPRSDA